MKRALGRTLAALILVAVATGCAASFDGPATTPPACPVRCDDGLCCEFTWRCDRDMCAKDEDWDYSAARDGGPVVPRKTRLAPRFSPRS